MSNDKIATLWRGRLGGVAAPLQMSAHTLRIGVAALLLSGQLTGAAERASSKSLAELAQEVMDSERAFARTMASRDLAAFGAFVADEAVFLVGPTPVRGKQQIIEAWRGYYLQPAAPFSWTPERVEVLDSGNLALSTGPVRDPTGRLIRTFTSIWRLDASGTWHVVFDQGCEVCAQCEPAPVDLRHRPER